MVKPYQIISSTENTEIRLFKDYKNTDLVWHRDAEDREVTILEGDIEVQLDNSLPQQMKTGDTVTVPKNTYHRAICSEPFKIRVKKCL